LSNQKVKYVDWFGSKIDESTDDMAKRIQALQKENTVLRRKLLEIELDKDKKGD